MIIICIFVASYLYYYTIPCKHCLYGWNKDIGIVLYCINGLRSSNTRSFRIAFKWMIHCYGPIWSCDLCPICLIYTGDYFISGMQYTLMLSIWNVWVIHHIVCEMLIKIIPNVNIPATLWPLTQLKSLLKEGDNCNRWGFTQLGTGVIMDYVINNLKTYVKNQLLLLLY